MNKKAFADFDLFCHKADVIQELDGTWTIHCEGFGNPGKLYNNHGNNAFEALENGWDYIQSLKHELQQHEKR